jgi:hypothetical protein
MTTGLGADKQAQTRQLQTGIVSVAGIRLDPGKFVRPFKGIFCDDIFEFESDHPSQAVRSAPPLSPEPERSEPAMPVVGFLNSGSPDPSGHQGGRVSTRPERNRL